MSKKPTPFTHVNEIYKVGGSFKGDEGYAQYIINKELSKNGMLVELVNEIQQHTLTNNVHFKMMNGFFPYSRRPGFKQFPWIWKGSEKPTPEVLGVARYYEESLDNARVLTQILEQSKEGKKQLKHLAKVYGGKR